MTNHGPSCDCEIEYYRAKLAEAEVEIVKLREHIAWASKNEDACRSDASRMGDRALTAEAKLPLAEERTRQLRADMEYVVEQCGIDDPNFVDLTPLQFAARLGLIHIRARQALSTTEKEKDNA